MDGHCCRVSLHHLYWHFLSVQVTNATRYNLFLLLGACIAYNTPALTAYVVSTNPSEAPVAASTMPLFQYSLGAIAAAVTPSEDHAIGIQSVVLKSHGPIGSGLTLTIAGVVVSVVYLVLLMLYLHDRKQALLQLKLSVPSGH